MSPKCRLVYFNSRGLAELIRLVLAQAGVEYEDVRLDKEKFQEIKPTLPLSKVPVLEVEAGVLAESRAIARYVARENGLIGKNSFETALCDMLIDSVYDLFEGAMAWQRETDETKKAELLKHFLTETAPPVLTNYRSIIEKNGTGYFVGDSLTWADIGLAYALDCLSKIDSSIIDAHAPLKAHIDKVLSLPNIKAWIDKRPVTEV